MVYLLIIRWYTLLLLFTANLRRAVRIFFDSFKKHLEKTQQLKKVSLEAILKRFPSLVVAYPQVDFRSKKVLLMTVHKAMYGIDPILSEKIRLQDMAEKNKRTLILLDEQEHDVSFHEG